MSDGAPADNPAAAPADRRREQLLSAEAVLGLDGLEARARVTAEGLLTGLHKSRRFGSSSEFAEHKIYAPGDDLKRLDWKAFARVDRYFVRRYEEETNLDVALIVDTSGSMAYAGGARGAYGASKLDVACVLAGATGFVARAMADAPALSLFAGAESSWLPARSRSDQLPLLLSRLEQASAAGPTDVRAVARALGDRLRRRALIVLFSDLIDTDARALQPLGVLRRRGCDVVIVHTLHRDELDFPFDGVVRFEDMEGAREVQVEAPLVRDAYLEELGAWMRGLRETCASLDLRLTLAPTDQPPAATLRQALTGTRALGSR